MAEIISLDGERAGKGASMAALQALVEADMQKVNQAIVARMGLSLIHI